MVGVIRLRGAVAVGGLERLGELAAEGDAQADGIIERLGLRVGRGVCAAATLLDVDTIVFGGPTGHVLGDRLLTQGRCVLRL
ncbi:hypothetical protein [Streptomyces sp. NPDC058247]|uniref:hypothetical protein n=1 Tax=Streptomyces sp. NPDC058247 TaxID=3346401 RepID=UPI0036EBFFFB